jgi:predicted DCC family thiol-disulfide oxidoreductase YuxK
MRFLFNKYLAICNKKVDATGLAMFRIVYGLILFFEVLQTFYFRNLMFDPLPFIERSEINTAPALIIWLGVIILLILGAFTRTAAIINYLFTLIFISHLYSFEYHLDYTITGVNFIMIFLPVSKSFSIDRLILKLKKSTLRSHYSPSKEISSIFPYLILGLGVGLVYFDSVFYKLSSPMWLSGLGFWLPASLPFATYLDLSFILNQKYIVLLMGYIVIAFEALFLFLIWFKRFHIGLLVIGLLLHIGILIAYPIPLFALGVAALYVLLLPESFFNYFRKKLKSSKPVLKVFYDEECPLCVRTKIIISHFDIFKKIEFKGLQSNFKSEEKLNNIQYGDLIKNLYSIDEKGLMYKGLDTYIKIFSHIWFLKPVSLFIRVPGIKYIANSVYTKVASERERNDCNENTCSVSFLHQEEDYSINSNSFNKSKVYVLFVFIVYCLFAQLISITHSPLFNKISSMAGISSIVHNFRTITYPISDINLTLFGITRHPVFMDNHFSKYNQIVAVTHVKDDEEVWLPMIDEKGQAGLYNTGRQWVNYTFRTSSGKLSKKRLKTKMVKYIAFWAAKNKVDLSHSQFRIKVKEIQIPTQWEENWLRNQINIEWEDRGYIQWTDYNAEVFINEDGGIE